MKPFLQPVPFSVPTIEQLYCFWLLTEGKAILKKNAADMQRWLSKNREVVKARKRAAHHRDKANQNAISLRYYYSNKEKRRIQMRGYETRRRATDPVYRLRNSIRKSIAIRLRGQVKGGKPSATFMGCTVAELKAHLEKQFQPGMTWDNYGYHGWHVDHRIPCAKFDLSDLEQVKRCFHFSNLQPMWKDDNFFKRAKVGPEFNNTQTVSL